MDKRRGLLAEKADWGRVCVEIFDMTKSGKQIIEAASELVEWAKHPERFKTVTHYVKVKARSTRFTQIVRRKVKLKIVGGTDVG